MSVCDVGSGLFERGPFERHTRLMPQVSGRFLQVWNANDIVRPEFSDVFGCRDDFLAVCVCTHVRNLCSLWNVSQRASSTVPQGDPSEL